MLQRVKSASVTVDGQLISSIGKGLLVLAAISKDDTDKDVESMASKILKAKLWDDESTDPPGRVSSLGSSFAIQNANLCKWKCNVSDIQGEVLCGTSSLLHPHLSLLTALVSQFTLLASMKKGNKPSFHQSASGEKAKALYQNFFNKVKDLYEPHKVKDGLFAAMMDVALVNDGPVGLDYTCLDSEVQPQQF